MMKCILSTLGASFAVLALAGPSMAQFDPSFDPPLAVDLNPDPDIVEINLTAAPVTWQFIPGVDTDALAYNGTIPGPMIEAKVGDKLIVHFTNNLGEPTTIHWHGVDGPANMDGSHISQLKIPDGGTFDYEFDLLTPGLKWYHPHVRTDYMVEHGLYGALLVRDPVWTATLDIQGHEHVIMWDDIAIDEVTGELDTFVPTDPLEKSIYFLSGRRGNVMLVNGKKSTSVQLQVPNGEPQRWWVVNVSNASFTRLDLNEYYESTPAAFGDPYLEGCSLLVCEERWYGPVWKIGGDRGFISERQQRLNVLEVAPPAPDHPTFFDNFRGILLVPGERMEVSFTPYGDDGEILPVDQWDWPRGDHVAFYNPDMTIGLGDEPMDGYGDTLLYFDMVLQGTDPGPPYYEPRQFLKPFVELDEADVTKAVKSVFGHMMPSPTGDVMMFVQMDGMTMLPFPMIDSPKAFDLEVGDVVLWTVQNNSHGDHPFHTHGFPFQVLDFEYIDDVAGTSVFEYPAVKENKDTVLLPQRPGMMMMSRTIMRALMEVTDTGREGQVAAQGGKPSSTTSGGWLFHCHILEHAKIGMMSFFEVRYGDDPFANVGGGITGPTGFAHLGSSGTTTVGGTVTLELSEASPNVPTIPIVGLSELNLPYLTGLLVPSLDFVLPAINTDSNGDLNIPFTWMSGLPVGASLWTQFWALESDFSLSASNGLRITQL